jgi:DNA-binding response OmpR family regulator
MPGRRWLEDANEKETVKRVLVVDDDLTTRNGLAEFLADAGFECTAVGSFQEAVALLRTLPPDLLITDIRLQEYNGLQLVVMANPLGVPAIVFTGFADQCSRAWVTVTVPPIF